MTWRRRGTVHLANLLDELTMSAAQIAMHQLPAAPFVLLGQMTTADPTRSPAGTESVWAYTSLPQRLNADADGEISDLESADGCERFADRIERRIERYAPGFRERAPPAPASTVCCCGPAGYGSGTPFLDRSVV